MRRVSLMLVCSMVLAFAGASVARAGDHHGGRHGGHHGGYRGPVHHGGGHHGGGYRGGYGGAYGHGHGHGWCGTRGGYAYGVPAYPYAYPQAGFGLALPNFSFWYAQ